MPAKRRRLGEPLTTNTRYDLIGREQLPTPCRLRRVERPQQDRQAHLSTGAGRAPVCWRQNGGGLCSLCTAFDCPIDCHRQRTLAHLRRQRQLRHPGLLGIRPGFRGSAARIAIAYPASG